MPAIRKQIMEQHGGAIPALQRYEILRAIHAAKSLRDKALIAFLYLSGARIEEILRFRKKVCAQCQTRVKDLYKGKSKTKENWCVKCEAEVPFKSKVVGQPINKDQIEQTTEYIKVYNVRVLKSKKINKRRTIPIIRAERETEFIKIFEAYLDTIKPASPLFSFSRQRAHQILSEVNLFPHFLRHCRLTHLATDYGFNEARLQHFTGWDTTLTAPHYTHLNVEDLMIQMKKNS